MQETPNLTDEMIVGRRPDSHGHLPEDMPRWMSSVIVAIDTFSLWVGRAVAWLTLPLMLGIVYEVFARYWFTAPRLGVRHQPLLYARVHTRRRRSCPKVAIRADFIFAAFPCKLRGHRYRAFLSLFPVDA